MRRPRTKQADQSTRSSNPPVNRNYKFWLVYFVAWLPYAGSYAALFVSTMGDSFFAAIKDSVFNVLPAAILGVGVVEISSRLKWSQGTRARFLLEHSMMALLYAALWITAVPLFFSLEGILRGGHWRYRQFVSYAFQWEFFAGLMIYATIAGIVYALEVTGRLRAEEARADRAENLRTRAELEALKTRLNPHFLFNTLHTLMALVHHNPKAEEALERFSALLRYALQTGSGANASGVLDEVTFAEEWSLVQNYLALEDLRLGSRLRLIREIDPESLNCKLPALTLQPIVENAIRHAITPRAKGGTLRIASQFEPDGCLCLEVSDDGPGAELEAVTQSKGLGIRVVRDRLEASYNGNMEFRITSAPGNGFAIMIRIPQKCCV